MLNAKQKEFVDYAFSKFNKKVLTIAELKEANKKFGCKYAPQWLIKNKDYKVDKSTFKLPIEGDVKPQKKKNKRLFPRLNLKRLILFLLLQVTLFRQKIQSSYHLVLIQILKVL
jgi:hypothetical protein